MSLLLYPKCFVIVKMLKCNCYGEDLKAKAPPETRTGTQYEFLTKKDELRRLRTSTALNKG